MGEQHFWVEHAWHCGLKPVYPRAEYLQLQPPLYNGGIEAQKLCAEPFKYGVAGLKSLSAPFNCGAEAFNSDTVLFCCGIAVRNRSFLVRDEGLKSREGVAKWEGGTSEVGGHCH